METKKSFIILAGIVVIILLVAGVIFFKKDQGGKILKNNKTETHQTVPPKPEPRKLSEEEKVKIMAENFARSYYSYTWGEFGLVEGLYCDMTEEMKEGEAARVERMKEEIKNQPRKYFTAQARIVSSDFIEYQNNKASLNIDLEIEEFNGLVINLEEVETLVDVDGNVYEGDLEDLVGKMFNKKVKITLIKIEDKWKVNKIEN